jgi:hypothetical protein
MSEQATILHTDFLTCLPANYAVVLMLVSAGITLWAVQTTVVEGRPKGMTFKKNCVVASAMVIGAFSALTIGAHLFQP